MVDTFSLKFHRDNRQNALALYSAKRKTEKRLYFHSTVEMKQPQTITEPQKIWPQPFLFGFSQRFLS